MAQLSKANLNADIVNNIYTNKQRLIKGNSLRQRLLNLKESTLNVLDDANSINGFLAISSDGRVNVSFIKSSEPEGKYLRDDGSFQTVQPLPSMAGNNNKVLFTDGSNPVWTALNSGHISTALGFTPVSSETVATAVASYGFITGNQTIALSGQASGSGATSISVTLDNNAVIGKTLTGYLSITGTVSASDSIVSAISKLNGNIGLRLTANQTITLSGQASGSGSTSIAVTLDNNSVIGKVLTGYSSTTGAVSASDSIVSAISKLNGNIGLCLTGNQTITLSGHVSGSGTTSISVALDNSSVIGQKLNGYSPTSANIVNGIDTILSAINKLQLFRNMQTDNITAFDNGTYASTKAIQTYVISAVPSIVASYGYITGNQTITLSGQASGSGATSIAVTLDNNSVVGKVITGYLSSPGTVSASDSIVSAFSKLNGNVGLCLTANQTITLSGHVTGSGSTSISVALDNSSVTGQKLNGYSPNTTGNIVNGTDTILSAINKLQLFRNMQTDNITTFNNSTYASTKAIQTYVTSSVGDIAASFGFITGNQTITLSGQASGSGATSISVSLDNNSVISKTLSGFTGSAGTVSASDSIVSAISKIVGNIATIAAGGGGGVSITSTYVVYGTGSSVTGDKSFIRNGSCLAIGLYGSDASANASILHLMPSDRHSSQLTFSASAELMEDTPNGGDMTFLESGELLFYNGNQSYAEDMPEWGKVDVTNIYKITDNFTSPRNIGFNYNVILYNDTGIGGGDVDVIIPDPSLNRKYFVLNANYSGGGKLRISAHSALDIFQQVGAGDGSSYGFVEVAVGQYTHLISDGSYWYYTRIS